jgi:predicted ester cyclase
MSSAETLKSLVRHVVEEATRGNLDILQEHPGMHETIPMRRQLNAGLSERKVTFPLQFTDGEWVATRIISSGVHTGPLMGHAPTHKRMEVEVLMFHRIVDGKIVRQQAVADALAAMDQLGVTHQEAHTA